MYLDGHSHHLTTESGVHSQQPYKIKNKDQNYDVPVIQTKYEFEYAGLIDVTFKEDNTKIIDTSNLTLEQVKTKVNADEEALAKKGVVTTKITNIETEKNTKLGEVIGSTEVSMSKANKKYKEIPLGNFCTDAYRYVYDADCAMINCGGLRGNVSGDESTGNITKSDMLDANAFGNELVCIETKGQNIIDALEFGARNLIKDIKVEPAGEVGCSPIYDVSGISYEINLGVNPDISTDDKGNLISIGNNRRVSNVKINGNDIDPSKTYKVAGSCYVLTDKGEGLTTFSRGDTKVIPQDNSMKDYEALIEYVKGNEFSGGLQGLNGVIPASLYGNIQGRIIRSDMVKIVTYDDNGADINLENLPLDQKKIEGLNLVLAGDTGLARNNYRLVG